MVTDFRIDSFALARSNPPLQEAQSSLSGITVAAPDPGMYGQLIGSAAGTTEPQTTEHLNDLIAALAEVFQATSDGVVATGECYQQLERDHVDLIAGGITRSLG